MDNRFDLRGKRIFVAGHRGMVGSAIVRGLAGEDCEIVTVSRDELDLLDLSVRGGREWHDPRVAPGQPGLGFRRRAVCERGSAPILHTLRCRNQCDDHHGLTLHRPDRDGADLAAAVDQLEIAVRNRSSDFYELSSAESRLRELRAMLENERAAEKALKIS